MVRPPQTPTANRLTDTRGWLKAPGPKKPRTGPPEFRNDTDDTQDHVVEKGDAIIHSARAWNTGADRKIMFEGPGKGRRGEGAVVCAYLRTGAWTGDGCAIILPLR